MKATAKTVYLNKEPTELFRILKFEGLASSGGEAKQVIDMALVKVNGEVETRKRRKMMSGDMIEFDGACLVLALDVGA